MKEKNAWIMQGTNISCRHKRSLYTFTKSSNDATARVHIIKYYKMLRKIIKEAKLQ
jgi:ribosomal protein L33